MQACIAPSIVLLDTKRLESTRLATASTATTSEAHQGSIGYASWYSGEATRVYPLDYRLRIVEHR